MPPTQTDVQEAIDLAGPYLKQLYIDITGPNGEEWGAVREGPGVPVAVWNESRQYWRYPGKRDAFRGENLGGLAYDRTDKYRYKCEDLVFSFWEPISDFNDLVFDIWVEFPNSTQTTTHIDIISRDAGDELHLYLADELVSSNPQPNQSWSLTRAIGKHSSALQYSPRYQRSLGQALKELGYVTEGNRCIQMFDDVTSQWFPGGAWDAYEVMFGLGAGRHDDWILTDRTFNEIKTYWSFPAGKSYRPYRTTLITPATGPWYNELAPYFISLFMPGGFAFQALLDLQDMKIPTSGHDAYVGNFRWDSMSFAISPTYDALKALHLMNKYGTKRKYEIERYLNRVGWNGHGARRFFMHPRSLMRWPYNLPGLSGDRDFYSGFTTGPFALAVTKWAGLTGDPQWESLADEVIEEELKLAIDNNESCGLDGCFYRPVDQGGAYITYRWNESANRYEYKSGGETLVKLVGAVAEKFWYVANYTFTDISHSDQFVNTSVTSYEHTLGLAMAMIEYKKLKGWS